MATTSDLLAGHTGLGPDRLRHLLRLLDEWQLIADLSFADLLLYLPRAQDLICVAQVRPTTAPTNEALDRVGLLSTDAGLLAALRTGREVHDPDPGATVGRAAVPVRLGGEVIAVVGRVTTAITTPSPLEVAYVACGDDLCQMIAAGRFPPPGPDDGAPAGADVARGGADRAGEGMLRLDATGVVRYASPTAWSVFRRLGVSADLTGAQFSALMCDVVDAPPASTDVGARIDAAVAGVAVPPVEVEARGAIVWLRVVPLRPPERRPGALVLIRDVTDVRRRDRALSSKDASIREIHHRVKNNLQTVAALLRLQARRMTVPAARVALQQSVRRVSSIALVHETLAIALDEWVDFDGIADRLMPMVVEVASAGVTVHLHREGTFGILGADIATPLVMVLTELLHNAVEHAYPDLADRPAQPGVVALVPTRGRHHLEVRVSDDGAGLPPGFSLEASDRLGLQIVRTLVESELQGTITLSSGPTGGTVAVLSIPLPAEGPTAAG